MANSEDLRVVPIRPDIGGRMAGFAEPATPRPAPEAPSLQAPSVQAASHPRAPALVAFDRHELRQIMNVYGRMVAAGEWRDYAIDFGPERAVFSIFRRTSDAGEALTNLARAEAGIYEHTGFGGFEIGAIAA